MEPHGNQWPDIREPYVLARTFGSPGRPPPIQKARLWVSGMLQTQQVLENIARALKQAGASLSDVVRTRMFVVNIDDWELVARVHGEVFGKIRPVTTMIEVSRLIAPEILVEIEAEAFVISETAH